MEKYIQDFEEELSSIGLNKKLYSYLLEKAFSQASFYGPRGIVRGGRMPLPNQRT